MGMAGDSNVCVRRILHEGISNAINDDGEATLTRPVAPMLRYSKLSDTGE